MRQYHKKRTENFEQIWEINTRKEKTQWIKLAEVRNKTLREQNNSMSRNPCGFAAV